ncbi:C10 family peptidase [Hymenobacter sp. YC55]|nr:C10 family peptidase [Hymenobacter sp. YC55]
MFVPVNEASVIAENAFTKGAISLGTGLFTSDRNVESKTAHKPKKKKIRSQKTVEEEGSPAFYIFNYEEGGWSIIAADYRLMPVLAYAETGSFNGEAAPAGLRKWEDGIKTITHDVRLSKLRPSKTTEHTWKRLKGDVTATIVPPEDPDPVDYTYTVGPLLTTTWDQGVGYNYFCPPVTGGPDGKAWTGCVPTAMAQVMRYYQYPSSYSWGAMANEITFSGPNEVARLMADIFSASQLHIIEENKYDQNGTGASSGDISETFKNSTFQYHSSNRQSYNYASVKSELQYAHPVILDGCNDKTVTFFFPRYTNCHAWVCDGYQESTYNGNGYLFFHMNWGWGSGTDGKIGWYSYNNWQITFSNGTTRNYQNDNDMIVNIRP